MMGREGFGVGVVVLVGVFSWTTIKIVFSDKDQWEWRCRRFTEQECVRCGRAASSRQARAAAKGAKAVRG